MSVEIRELTPPVDIRDGEAKAAARVERLLKLRLQRLSEGQVDRLEKHIGKKLKDARRETEPLRRKLVRYSDLLEGIVEETNFPFEGASNITLRAAAGLARTFEASFNPSIYQDPDLFAPDFEPGTAQELKLDAKSIQVLQEGFNHSFSRKFNGLRVLKGGTIPAFRDGTFLVEGSWERKVERVSDQRTYKKYEEFVKDYPDPESAGLSSEEYSSILDYFLTDGPDAELIVRFFHDLVKFEGIEYRQLLRAKFFVYPSTTRHIEDAELYGGSFDLPKDEVKRRAKRGHYYEDGVRRALARRNTPLTDQWDRNRLYVEGIATPSPESSPIRLCDLVIKYDLDKDGVLEQYHATVIAEQDFVFLVSFRPYDLRHNVPSVVPFRLVARDHAFDGISMVGDGEDLFNQIDTLFRHDNNVMMLTTSPIFLAQQDLKEQIDLGRAENIIRPGVTYWVPDISKAITQLPVQDIAAASGDNNTKLSIISRFLEMLIGVSQGESGQQAPDDPRSPARKTTLLLMQAGKRIDRCLDEWCESLPSIAKLHATLLYQYSPERSYSFEDRQGQVRKFDVSILADSRLRWLARRRSVSLTPEFALNRLQMLFQSYAALRPLLLQGDPVAIELWNRTVRNSGEPQAEKFMVDAGQAPQLAEQAVKKAMMQFQQQSRMKAMAKGEEKLATESAKATVKVLDEQARAQLSGLPGSEPQPQQQQMGQPPRAI